MLHVFYEVVRAIFQRQSMHDIPSNPFPRSKSSECKEQLIKCFPKKLMTFCEESVREIGRLMIMLNHESYAHPNPAKACENTFCAENKRTLSLFNSSHQFQHQAFSLAVVLSSVFRSGLFGVRDQLLTWLIEGTGNLGRWCEFFFH